jgi:antitoxin (DNA-binding transcriptional repressor) of toxin-antitoxin stability system
MKQLAAEDAAQHLPELLMQLHDGEEMLLEVNGRVVAKVIGCLHPATRSSLPPCRQPGFAKGMITMREDFGDPLEDFEPYQ